MSQWELSERAGIHKNTPGLIERGERSPALETINAIAGALGAARLRADASRRGAPAGLGTGLWMPRPVRALVTRRESLAGA